MSLVGTGVRDELFRQVLLTLADVLRRHSRVQRNELQRLRHGRCCSPWHPAADGAGGCAQPAP
ncbi:hypothetical protein P4123_29295 [Pseudomonas aeruginosa]|nr:hypothetical protein [Pseudomonas aeruginosa]